MDVHDKKVHHLIVNSNLIMLRERRAAHGVSMGALAPLHKESPGLSQRSDSEDIPPGNPRKS